MTCREFKHAAASLTLWELSRPQDEQLLDHADACPKCGAWLDSQQMLAATMQTLQDRTAGLQAGPHVERALLRVFRQVPFEATQPVAAHRFTPVALRWSRFFEIGAYAAVAAAIVVGLFLGVRLLEERSAENAARSQSVPASTASVQPAQAATGATAQTIAPPVHKQAVAKARRERAVRPVVQNASAGRTSTPAAAQVGYDADYVALMFCDPLICSSDTQVVRMELPATGAASDRNAQTQVADVVVGYDGLVRAMRIVN